MPPPGPPVAPGPTPPVAPGPTPPVAAPALDPAFVAEPTVVVSGVSVFFGQKVALSELSCSFGPGVTGLLGPNGAGKTTLMRAVTGLVSVSSGQVWVAGGDPRKERTVQGHIGLVPEDEAVPGGLTPRELARYRAALHSVADREAPDRWLAVVGLLDVADRVMDGFSKGMRQRAKVAAALVSNPTVLILDEPLNGADPVQRGNLIRLFRQLGDQGRTVLVSSHVLYEVERLAERVVVLVRGRLAAAGDRRSIRDAMADRPRRVLVRADPARVLAAALAGHDAVGGVEVDGDRLTVATRRAGDLALALPTLARGAGVRLWEVRPLDESLEALFRELVR
jgi:ABC-2 type transport system ATP-binding protein